VAFLFYVLSFCAAIEHLLRRTLVQLKIYSACWRSF